MHPVTLTLTFPSLHEAQVALAAVENACCPDTRQVAIDFADRPDVGAQVVEKIALAAASFAPAEFNPFAAASTAVVAAAPTAPVVPPVTSTAVLVPPAPALPAAPVASAPVVPAAQVSPAGIVVDKDGLPWDSRIHAGGGKDGKRPTNKDGTWRQKRGLNDDALKARVEAELRQAMGAPAASVPVVPTPPAAPATVVPAPPSTTAESPAAPVVPAPPAVDTYQSLIGRLGPHLVSGKLTQAHLSAACAAAGLQSMGQLPVRPDLVPTVAAQIDAMLAAA